MQSLPLFTNTLFEQLTQVLPADYQQQAYELGAFARARKIQSPQHLLWLVMAYCGLDHSLRSCAGKLTEQVGYVCDMAVFKRLTACLPWLKALTTQVLASLIDTPHIEGGLRFITVDGSTAQVPGARETSYRLHLAADLVKHHLLQAEVTDAHVGESLSHYHWQAGDVVLIDRGYNQPRSLVPVIDQGVEVVLRYNPHGMTLYTRTEPETSSMTKVDWLSVVQAMDGQAGCVPVYLRHERQRIAGVVHLMPLPSERVDEAKRKLRERAQKKGYTPSAEALALCGWVFVFTSVPESVLNTDSVMQLYRTRWQIELVIKRLKSLLHLDRLRSRLGSTLSEVYLQGKLLYAAMLEKLVRQRFDTSVYWLDKPRQETPWRLLDCINQEVKGWISAVVPKTKRDAAEVLRAMRERPRRRTLQALPQTALLLIDSCRKQGLSNV